MAVVFDDLFKTFGGFGRYQFLIVVLLFTRVLLPSRLMLNFISARMDHWCRVPELEGLGEEIQKLVSIPNGEDTADGYDGCSMFDINYGDYTEEDFLSWTRLANSTATKRCDSGWMYDRSTYAETTVSEFDLVCSRSNLVPLPATLSFAGALVGTIIAGHLSDRYGRKKILIVASLIDLVGGVLAAVAPYNWVFCVGIFIQGLASNAIYMAGWVIVMEIVGPRHRALVGMAINVLMASAFFTAALQGYFIRKFRILQAIPITHTIFLVALFWHFLPDPPRWLIQQDRLTEAGDVFRKLAKVNGIKAPTNLDDTLQEIRDEEIMMRSTTKKRTLLDLYSSRVLLIRSMVLNFFWFGVSMMHYALSLNAGVMSGDIYLNMLFMGLTEVAAQISGGFIMNVGCIGRRYTAFGTMTLAGITGLTQVALIALHAAGSSTNAMALLGKAFAVIGFFTIYVLSTETFPTEVRHAGMGAASVCARIGGMIAPYMGPPMSQFWEPLPQMIFGSCAVIAGISILIVPETIGLPLTQTIEEATKRSIKGYNMERQLHEASTKTDPNESAPNISSTVKNTQL